MSILIKDMKMPKDCVFCPMAHWNKIDRLTGCDVVGGKRYVPEDDAEYWNSDHCPDWCPLVEVSTPHGRLIDGGTFEANMQNEWERNEISNSEWIHFREMINAEPTIIEAEE